VAAAGLPLSRYVDQSNHQYLHSQSLVIFVDEELDLMDHKVLSSSCKTGDLMVSQLPCISSTASLILDLPPCCVAFSPTNPKFFVVGTYHLEDSPGPDEKLDGLQTRSGSLELFSLEGHEM